jgi:hypothetical protein
MLACGDGDIGTKFSPVKAAPWTSLERAWEAPLFEGLY